MKKEFRTVVYDEELKIEAYRFEGIVRPFPNHFHQHYVIGLVECGQRKLLCKNKEYIIDKGGIVLFNPEENHACEQNDDGTLDYKGFHINKDILLHFAEEVTGNRTFLFSKNVIYDEEISYYLHSLYEMINNGTSKFKKEEMLLFLISSLIQKYGQNIQNLECRKEIEKACEYMEQHYTEQIYLDQICHYANISKSTLLRAFTNAKGITPYRYLENIRINKAKKLLEKGTSPLYAAMQTGFSDQSHFTNYFSSFIGLAPGVYREIFLNNKRGEKTWKITKDI